MEKNLKSCAVEDTCSYKKGLLIMAGKVPEYSGSEKKIMKLMYDLMLLEPIHQPGCPVAV